MDKFLVVPTSQMISIYFNQNLRIPEMETAKENSPVTAITDLRSENAVWHPWWSDPEMLRKREEMCHCTGPHKSLSNQARSANSRLMRRWALAHLTSRDKALGGTPFSVFDRNQNNNENLKSIQDTSAKSTGITSTSSYVQANIMFSLSVVSTNWDHCFSSSS